MASARAHGVDAVTIREVLEQGIDWTRFARKVTDQGVAHLCGFALARVAPDLIPGDILDAFRVSRERTSAGNRAAFDEIVHLHDALARTGIEVIALRGPVLAFQAYGDPGLRESGRCDLLVRESDAASVSARVRAAEKPGAVGANVRTGLTSAQAAPDAPRIGYAELRQRARRMEVNGHLLLLPAPEDGLLALALHGAQSTWRRMKSACDVAAFVGSQPIDWNVAVARARETGSARTLALALTLAVRYFGSNAPRAVLEPPDPMIDSLVERILAGWHEAAAPPKKAAPRDASAWIESAQAMLDSKRFGEAVEASDNALQLDPANVEAKHLGVFARLRSCDWRRLEDDKLWIAECAKTHPRVIWPSLPQLFYYEKGSELERLAIEQIPASGHAHLPEPLWRGERYQHPEIRIAYLSAGLSSDPMAALATGVFEHHDRERFDVTAISLGRDAKTPMRGRIEAASRRFIQADKMSDSDVAATLRDLQVDIVLDLNGYTGKRNPAVLAFRPAPVQVNFGYPGTMALPYMDYIMADRIVIPPEHESRFGEKAVFLPHSFQPNDCNRPTVEETPSRADVGLPVSGFVFACFNTSYKITPTLFDIWMRLLHRVENSVLWLLADSPSATLNLRREARTRGIDPERLIFAPRIPPVLNVARQRLADLFLDTIPMNAQATASDALWAGLPVLTCLGDIFRARVAAGLLHAVGLPELVASSLAEYEELAVSLAHDGPRLNSIKARLMRNRNTAPLFDTRRYTTYLESAYTLMWERSRRGLPPVAFEVDA